MFFKKPSHRIFDYTPQFYKPEEDEKGKEKKETRFQKTIKS